MYICKTLFVKYAWPICKIYQVGAYTRSLQTNQEYNYFELKQNNAMLLVIDKSRNIVNKQKFKL